MAANKKSHPRKQIAFQELGHSPPHRLVERQLDLFITSDQVDRADERESEIRVCDAQVDYQGTVQWQPRAIYKSACQVHIKYFPFDQQNCRMKFGPWTYDGSLINDDPININYCLVPCSARTNITFYNNFDAADLSDYEPSPEWELVSTKAVYTATRYPCCPHIYPDITFSVMIKRQPAFYNYVIILPCFLLSSLTLVLFCLPPETPAKMQLGKPSPAHPCSPCTLLDSSHCQGKKNCISSTKTFPIILRTY
ncbi:unnamed protein product [Dibothriocephalus latus]|uniref:Neurotransmitter-gated ion-channel ligand-binding domain-containing protein n=1 Tax=Dibothriocephalus latus TaxID=60516 RepID=A0A3P6SVH2_DIBLA|nr:unnamed protein product [Dibothriocephalus latus]